MIERQALWLHCRYCGETFHVYPSQARPFCSMRCSQAWHRRSIAERLADRVVVGPADACWPFVGGRNEGGYGKIYGGLLPGEPLRHWTAHRAAFALAYELTTEQMRRQNVLHSCDNPRCCNPAHLWLGTQADNQADKVAKGRQTRGADHWTRREPARGARAGMHLNTRRRVVRGSEDGNARLSEEDVLAIRAAFIPNSHTAGMHALARQYGVHWHTIQLIVHGHTWIHVR